LFQKNGQKQAQQKNKITKTATAYRKGELSTKTLSSQLAVNSPEHKVKTVTCIRCGTYLLVCPHKLSPILIKEAYEKRKKEKLRERRVDL